MGNMPKLLSSIRPKQAFIHKVEIIYYADEKRTEVIADAPQDTARDMSIIMGAVALLLEPLARESCSTRAEVIDLLFGVLKGQEQGTLEQPDGEKKAEEKIEKTVIWSPENN